MAALPWRRPEDTRHTSQARSSRGDVARRLIRNSGRALKYECYHQCSSSPSPQEQHSLLRLLAQADTQSRGIWLLTNLYTTGFYAHFGFIVVGSFSLGDDNPTWEKGPVILCLVSIQL